jgi:acyl dehydratase
VIAAVGPFAGLADFSAAKGEHLGYSAWREVTQGQVDMFADATDDHQWIHVDPGRAATGPFGGTRLVRLLPAKGVLVQSRSSGSLRLAESSKHDHFNDHPNTLFP